MMNRDDLSVVEAQISVRGKGTQGRFLSLAPEANQTTVNPTCGWRRASGFNHRCLFLSRGDATRRAETPAGCVVFDTIVGTTGVKRANPNVRLHLRLRYGRAGVPLRP